MKYFNQNIYTDAFIIDFVTNVRKTTLKNDLYRHYWGIFKATIGIGNMSKKDICDNLSWCCRLQKIINERRA